MTQDLIFNRTLKSDFPLSKTSKRTYEDVSHPFQQS